MANNMIVHFVAYCQDCDWQTQDYIKGPKQAARHAREKQHLVVGDKGIAVKYDGRAK